MKFQEFRDFFMKFSEIEAFVIVAQSLWLIEDNREMLVPSDSKLIVVRPR